MKTTETDWLEQVQKKTIRFKRKYSLLVKENLEPSGITPFQLQILWILQRNSGMGTTQLAEKLSVKPSAVTMGSNQLCKMGLLNRVHSETDRRQIRLDLTVQGKKRLEEAMDLHTELASEVFSCFSETERDTLFQLMDKLEQNIC
ncbi:MarR family transcriptional regulator [Bacillus sp. FJAT-42376]|uniref:MarR family winged helix-turn-helix transcriptional regulator n=1 Tax=Bacillus sp. FJAT-42376 TaxID=2014076 RepID=UPI000F5072A7|nr:MarR family transcriptional regulator [Bacillus sp. FJAT-42376]AZB44078.1 MarR family transcriptional regulator [Bacillus sp. FJAT-42376]